MSFESFSRRGRRRRSYRRHDDQLPARAHEGTAQDFLTRHARECSQHDCSTLAERHSFATDFVERIADTRNLFCAAEHLASGGNKATGPNGQCLHRLLAEDRDSVWQELKRLSRAILDHTYEPGLTRRVNVPKPPGNGTRSIDVMDWQDQVVQRAVAQILDPFVDPLLDELSLGYRAGHDRFEAMAKAAVRMELEERYAVITADLQDAFTRIPHAPLLAELERLAGNLRLTQLISDIISANGRRRGVAQGGALSPLLLNVYLNRHLDQTWRRQHPDTPCIRVADDLLILCRSTAEAGECLRDLQRILTPTGMLLNQRKTQVQQLTAGQTADWLGYTISTENGVVRARLRDDFWENAAQHIREALAKPDGVLLVPDVLTGILDQLGPCWASEQQERVVCQLASLAAELGTDELPNTEELLKTWERSAVRYLVQRRLWHLVYKRETQARPAVCDGSADRILPALTAPQRPCVGASGSTDQAVSVSPPAVLTVTRAQSSHGVGGWAFHIRQAGVRRTRTRCETLTRTTPIRSALMGAVAGLRAVRNESHVQLVTDSAFLCDDWQSQAAACRRRGGLTRRGVAPANWDLLTALDLECGSWRHVNFEYCSSAGGQLAVRHSTAGSHEFAIPNHEE